MTESIVWMTSTSIILITTLGKRSYRHRLTKQMMNKVHQIKSIRQFARHQVRDILTLLWSMKTQCTCLVDTMAITETICIDLTLLKTNGAKSHIIQTVKECGQSPDIALRRQYTTTWCSCLAGMMVRDSWTISIFSTSPLTCGLQSKQKLHSRHHPATLTSLLTPETQFSSSAGLPEIPVLISTNSKLKIRNGQLSITKRGGLLHLASVTWAWF